MKKPLLPRLNLVPSITDVFFITTFLLLFTVQKSRLLLDGDTGYHIRAGDYILGTRSIPMHDIFSFRAPPLPWTAHEWLSEVIMSAIHSGFGLTGVVAFFALVLAATYALLFRILRAYGSDILIATTVTLATLATSQLHWLARPHLFSFLLMVIFHYLLESWQRGMFDRLYLLPPVMLLWVNLHGGFLAGFILLGIYLVGNLFPAGEAGGVPREARIRKAKQLAIITAACLAASLVNPHGYRILLFPFQLVSDSYIMDNVNEFLSPDFHVSSVIPFRCVLLLFIALLALSRKRLPPTDIILLLVFTNMALYSVRYIPLFALVTAPILARRIGEAQISAGPRLLEFYKKRSANLTAIDARATGYLWSAGAMCLVAAVTWSGKAQCGFDGKLKAVAACEFLMKERIRGSMFNNDEIGDYIIYRTYPLYRVFMDGRSDMYGADRLKEYHKVVAFQPGWEEILEKYHITWIIYNSDSDFSRFLSKGRQWRLIFSDRVASIFVKDIPQYKDLIEKYRAVTLAKPEKDSSH